MRKGKSHDPSRSRQLSDDARPPPREAVFRFGDKLSMTNKSPSPITNATPEEKLQTLFQDQALRNAERRKLDAGTFLSHTHSDEGGRFAKPQQVVGSAPVPEYPAGPNWSPQAVGVEPPLNQDVDAMEPQGESFEVAASIEALERTAQESIASLDAEPVRGAGAAPSDAASSAPANPIPINKRDR
jgi:hypothetical protein